jgi:DNA repair helicase Rad3
MKEMKKTEYRKRMTASCLASRDYYCVNETVSRMKTLNEKNTGCQELGSSCKYRKNKEYPKLWKELEKRMSNKGNRVIDIEDLVSAGKKCTMCPYYASTVVAQRSDIVFTPYNYILEMNQIDLINTAIIFDEGHNIEGACEDAASGRFSSFNVTSVINGLKELMEWHESADYQPVANQYGQEADLPSLEDMRDLYDFYVNFMLLCESQFLDQLNRPKKQNDPVVYKPQTKWFVDLLTKDPFNLLEEGRIDTFKTTASVINEYVKSAEEIMMPSFHGKNKFAFVSLLAYMGDFFTKVLFSVTNAKRDEGKVTPFANFQEFITTNFRLAVETIAPDDKFKKGKNRHPSKPEWRLTLYCMNPGVTIDKLVCQGVRTIIITSGTLAPLDSFESEMGLNFSQKLCNSHVISKDQLMIFNVSKVKGFTMDASHKGLMRAGMNYYIALGNGLIDFLKPIPNGVLIFFKSYKFKEDCLNAWRSRGYLDEIMKDKKIFDEPKNRKEFASVLSKYKRCIDSGRGGILLAVFRGKVSEGLDMANDYCRAAIIIGLPYAFWKDPYVEHKMDYLKKAPYLNAKKKKHVTADEWYEIQMLRAVNQAIGRIVRHRHDYGIVMLIDEKFKNERTQRGLSLWLKEFIRDDVDFKSKNFVEFFLKNEIKEKDINDNPLKYSGESILEVPQKEVTLEKDIPIIDLNSEDDLDSQKTIVIGSSPIAEQKTQEESRTDIFRSERHNHEILMSPLRQPEAKKFKASPDSPDLQSETKEEKNETEEKNISLFEFEDDPDFVALPEDPVANPQQSSSMSQLFSKPQPLGSQKKYTIVPLELTLCMHPTKTKDQNTSQKKKSSFQEVMEADFDDDIDDSTLMSIDCNETVVSLTPSKPIVHIKPLSTSIATQNPSAVRMTNGVEESLSLESLPKGCIKDEASFSASWSQLDSLISSELRASLGNQYMAKLRRSIHEFKSDQDVDKYIACIRNIIVITSLSDKLLHLSFSEVASSFVQFKDDCEKKSFLAACIVLKTQ